MPVPFVAVVMLAVFMLAVFMLAVVMLAVVMRAAARGVRMRVAHTPEGASRNALQHIDNSQLRAAATGSQRGSAAVVDGRPDFFRG